MKGQMSDSPSISDTLIDNLVSRKEIRADAIRRGRARERIEPFNWRQQMWNSLADANAQSPLSKAIIQSQLDNEDFPTHLALVPDGNRRWAWNRGLPVGMGYDRGSRKLEDFRRWSMVENNVDVFTCFTLSTENIERRPEDELAQLFEVFKRFFNRVPETESVHENEIKHEVRGNNEAMRKLPDDVRDAINNMEEATSSYNNKKLIFLMPYGSRDDIIKAARKTNTSPMTEGVQDISEQGEDNTEFRQNLMLGDLPDVDLMVRTSEKRMSNFMLYENAYSELVFLGKNWPSFTESDFYESIYKFSNRDRRFGV